MAALTQQFGQPHQLALQQIGKLMDWPNLNTGDVKASQTLELNPVSVGSSWPSR